MSKATYKNMSIICALIVSCLITDIAKGQLNPASFKGTMEQKVINLKNVIQNVYQTRCSNTKITDCKTKSTIMCDGTAKKYCMNNFPSANHKFPYLSLQSAINIPNIQSRFQLKDSQKQFVCATAIQQFQSQLQSLVAQNNKQWAWIYIGSRGGAFRRSPAQSYNHYNSSSGECIDYDPRKRPWFTQALYKRKNIIIMFGIKNTVNLSSGARLNAMKVSVKAILYTTYLDDTVAILVFSNTARPLLLDVDTLQDIQSQYNNSNQTILQAYLQKISLLTPDPGNTNNYEKAFTLGFEMINNTIHSNTSYTDSQQYIFMLFTDGNPDQGVGKGSSSDLQTFIQNKTNQINANLSAQKQIKISLVAFNINNSTNQVIITQDWSCLTNGMYIETGDVTTESQFFEAASELYDFYLLNNEYNQTVWSRIYTDQSGLGQMVTITVSAYQTIGSQHQLIGVIGIDVLVSQFTKYASNLTYIKNLLKNQGHPFVNTATDCQMQNIRKYKCKSLNCSTSTSFTCSTQINGSNIFKNAVDTSLKQNCDIAQNPIGIGLIVGIVIVSLIIISSIGATLYMKYFKLYCFKQQKPTTQVIAPQQQQKIKIKELTIILKKQIPPSRVIIDLQQTTQRLANTNSNQKMLNQNSRRNQPSEINQQRQNIQIREEPQPEQIIRQSPIIIEMDDIQVGLERNQNYKEACIVDHTENPMNQMIKQE